MLVRISILALTGLALTACPAQKQATLTGSGTKVRITVDPAFSLEVLNAKGEAVLVADGLSATKDRPENVSQILFGWDGYRAHEGEWVEVTGIGRFVQLEKDAARVELDSPQGTFSVTVGFSAQGRASITARAESGDFNKLAMHFKLRDDEHFFGLGERFVTVDHRGVGLYSWAEEGGLGAGEDAGVRVDQPYPNGPSMTYFPVPLVHSTRGYSLHATTTRRTEMHLGDESDTRWRVAVNGTELPFDVYVRPTMVERLDDYTRDTGRPPIPAPWVWGPRRHFGRNGVVGGQPEYRVMRERNLPITGTDDAVHFLPHHSYAGIEGELRTWTATAHAWGLKVTNYNTPYVSASDPSAAADYAYGVDAGLFEHTLDGSPVTYTFISGRPQAVSEIDLTTEPGVAWFKSLLERSLDIGYDGWMHDFGEYTQRASYFADGRRGDEVHNAFPVLSARAAYQLLEAERPNDYLFFVRSGYSGTQGLVPSMWGGDSEASFDDSQGLPAAVRGGINLALVGVPYYGSDVTGFKCITDDPHDKEMFVRWVEFGAVSPMMVEQNACSNPVSARSKWKLWDDDETQAVWREMAGLHTRLAPYFRALAVVAHASGLPLMRHPVLTHPDEREGWAVSDSYFLGPSLYAAPVVRRGVTSRPVWLPPGRFVEWNDKTVYSGPATVTVPAPLTRLPLFLAENRLVPLLDAQVQTLAPATEPSVVGRTEAAFAGVLDVVVALGPGGRAELQLADGTLLRATRGEAATTTLAAVAESALTSCESCFVASQPLGGVARLRLNGTSSGASMAAAEDVTVETSGPVTRLVRWDVWRLP